MLPLCADGSRASRSPSNPACLTLIKSRLTRKGISDYRVLGEPTTVDDAAELARKTHTSFNGGRWASSALALPRARKANQGIDGRLFYFDGSSDKPQQAIVSVKAGKVQVSHVRDLVGVINREGAEIGVFIALNEPTQPMRTEAASAATTSRRMATTRAFSC